MNYTALTAELTNDPLTRGYAGMSDTQAADSINTVDRTRNRTTLTGAEIYEATVSADFQALTATEKTYIRDLWSMGGDVQVGPGAKARAVLIAIFGGGSATVLALSALLVDNISRGDELNLGHVKAGHVQMARTLGA